MEQPIRAFESSSLLPGTCYVVNNRNVVLGDVKVKSVAGPKFKALLTAVAPPKHFDPRGAWRAPGEHGDCNYGEPSYIVFATGAKPAGDHFIVRSKPTPTSRITLTSK